MGRLKAAASPTMHVRRVVRFQHIDIFVASCTLAASGTRCVTECEQFARLEFDNGVHLVRREARSLIKLNEKRARPCACSNIRRCVRISAIIRGRVHFSLSPSAIYTVAVFRTFSSHLEPPRRRRIVLVAAHERSCSRAPLILARRPRRDLFGANIRTFEHSYIRTFFRLPSRSVIARFHRHFVLSRSLSIASAMCSHW